MDSASRLPYAKAAKQLSSVTRLKKSLAHIFTKPMRDSLVGK